ncbi:MAG: choice-of-anchor L domain-containing protein [Bacteroidales bacterium]|nr:choice-of-anchor L domain-containing protein [Bacteroidales bacterium]
MVQEILIGGGVETFNIEYTGNNISRGKFWGGPGNIGIEEGIILTSGAVTVAPGPNNSGSAGSNSNQGSDADLVQLSGTSINDACVLEFDFIPQSTVVTFKYCFGSEEYHEYVDQYNDAFGFFISGPGITGPYSNNSKNIALIPLTNIPVTINTVNCGNPYNCQEECDNCQYFVNNTQNFVQYDAFTKPLVAWANVIPCETYHIKLAIGDGIDHAYDSGVFLEKNSFSSVGIASQEEYTEPEFEFAIEGCNNVTIDFQMSIQPDADLYLPLMISGSAINGVDYEEISDSLFFPQGYSQTSIDIITIADGITEWNENIRLVFNSSLCGIDYDTINIGHQDYKLNLNMTPDTTINCATDAYIGVNSIIGFGPYDFVWSTGDTTPFITVSPLITTTYYVTCLALCDSLTVDSVTVFVDGPESHAGQDQSIPYGTTTTLQGSASQGSGEYTYSWEPAALLVDPASPTPTTLQMEQTTQFTLTVTDLAGNCQDLDAMMLYVTGGPLNVGPMASPAEICVGEYSQLAANAGGGSENYTYTWTSNPPGFSSDIPDPVVQPSINTTYHVTVNDGYNSVQGQVLVHVNALPIPEAGENDTIWYGTIGKLYGSAIPGGSTYSYSWEPADSLINPTAQNPTTYKLHSTNQFWLTVTDLNTGCVSADPDPVSVVVNGGPLAVTISTPDNLICLGDSTQLFAIPSGGNQVYHYNWSSIPPGMDDTTSSVIVSPSVNTTYKVEIFDEFNYTHTEMLVAVAPAPIVTLGADRIVCPLDSLVLSSNAIGNFYWSNGSTDQSIIIGSTGIGFDIRTVWLNVENENGCIGTDTIQIVFDFTQCSGVDELENTPYLYLYPNPTSGIVYYECGGLGEHIGIEVSDLQGNRIYNGNIVALPGKVHKGSLSLEGFSKGIYLFKLISDNDVMVRKVLLQ